jgi:hypothetical protein
MERGWFIRRCETSANCLQPLHLQQCFTEYDGHQEEESCYIWNGEYITECEIHSVI